MKEELSSNIEDYLEAIYLLHKRTGRVRISDIASFLRLKPPSVTEMLEKLKKKGLVQHEKYGEVSLTPRGLQIAEEIYTRHRTLVDFLLLLGVNPETAELDACKIEHVLSRRTLNRLRKFVEFLNRSKSEWLNRFTHFVKTGEYLVQSG